MKLKCIARTELIMLLYYMAVPPSP